MFAVITLGILAVILIRVIPALRRDREAEAQRPPRTEEERARDGQTARIWGCLVLLVPLLLVLAYFLTR